MLYPVLMFVWIKSEVYPTILLRLFMKTLMNNREKRATMYDQIDRYPASSDFGDL